MKLNLEPLGNGEYQKIWVSSDMHFNHANILKFEPEKRPYDSVEAMAEDYIDKHNSLVGVDDYYIHLGDFCFGREKIQDTASYLSRMKGNKIMLYGNHDYRWQKDEIGAFWVGDYLELSTQVQVGKNRKKARFVFFHYPIAQWNGKQKNVPCFHGHSHGSFDYVRAGLDKSRIKDMDVGSNNGYPYLLDDVYLEIKQKNNQNLDHHNENTT